MFHSITIKTLIQLMNDRRRNWYHLERSEDWFHYTIHVEELPQFDEIISSLAKWECARINEIWTNFLGNTDDRKPILDTVAKWCKHSHIVCIEKIETVGEPIINKILERIDKLLEAIQFAPGGDIAIQAEEKFKNSSDFNLIPLSDTSCSYTENCKP